LHGCLPKSKNTGIDKPRKLAGERKMNSPMETCLFIIGKFHFQDGFSSCWSLTYHIWGSINLKQAKNPSENACFHAFRDRN
jgi:hypothetical protein